MIVWLNVPFAQKDIAKRRGARWSAAQKKWFVQDAEDLAPFMQWIDDRLKQPTKQKPKSTQSRGGEKAKGNGKKLMPEFSAEAISAALKNL